MNFDMADFGNTWFNTKGEVLFGIDPKQTVESIREEFTRKKLSWMVYEGEDSKHDLYFEVEGVDRCYEKVPARP